MGVLKSVAEAESAGNIVIEELREDYMYTDFGATYTKKEFCKNRKGNLHSLTHTKFTQCGGCR
jgi:hypothetical protein